MNAKQQAMHTPVASSATSLTKNYSVLDFCTQSMWVVAVTCALELLGYFRRLQLLSQSSSGGFKIKSCNRKRRTTVNHSGKLRSLLRLGCI
jgi:hypothetical protein